MENSRRVFTFGKQIRNVGRLGQIATVFAKHGYGSLLERLGIERLLSSSLVKHIKQFSRKGDNQPLGEFTLASHLKKAFEELGPAFVKLGQMLAVREDLLPKIFIDELKKLHNHVEPADYSSIVKILNRELGDKIKDFESIEKVPLASGSIGQVYKAILNNGQQVVLKIQRPFIDHQIQMDLDLMELIASLIERHIPELRFIKPKTIIDEFRRATKGELDFIREAANTTRVGVHFKDVEYVSIPHVYWQYTTSRIIVLSYLDGLPVSDKQEDKGDNNNKILLERAINCFLKMVFVDGFYHGDLHPGNLLVQKDNKIALLDFGVTIKISKIAQRHLAGLLMDLANEDFDSLVAHFIELSDPGPDFDQHAFTNEIANALSPYMGITLEHLKSGKLLWELASIAAKLGAPLPRELVLFLRTMTAFEGIAYNLDPEFDVIASCQDFTSILVQEMYSTENLKQEGLIIAKDLSNLLRHAPFQIRRLLKSANEGDLSIHVESSHFHHIVKTLDRASARLSLSLVITGLIVGSAIISQNEKMGNYDSIVFVISGFGCAGILSIFLIFSIIVRKF